MLGALPEVFVPGFEPLDVAGLTQSQKLDFVEAVFMFPQDESGFAAWRASLLPAPQVRVNRSAVASFQQLAGKTSAGFKLRPYSLAWGGNHSHAAGDGVSRQALRALLDRRRVSVILTLRRNPVKEALSWYKARELGLRQFGRPPRDSGAAAHSRSLLHGRTSSASSAGLGSERRPQGQHPWRAVGQEARRLEAASDRRQQALLAADAATARQHGQQHGPVLANVSRVLEWLNYTEAVNQALVEAATSYDRPTLTIWYEDFLQDPLGQAARAAAFVGADPRRLRPSARFAKAGPDSLQEGLANFAELCWALHGTRHMRWLGVPHCPPAGATPSSERPKPNGGSGMQGAAPAQRSTPAAEVAATEVPRASMGHVSLLVPAAGAEPRSPPQLLSNWCAAPDKAATRWGPEVSDAECMSRFARLRSQAVAALRGFQTSAAAAASAAASSASSASSAATPPAVLLFKHVHKAGGSTLCQLAQRNMPPGGVESPRIPGRSDGWDTDCAPLEAFLGPHPAAGLVSGVASASSSASSRRRLAAPWLGGACWLGFLSPSQLRALPAHYRPLAFVASEGPLPDALPLDTAGVALVTMLRRPLDRVLSSYRWWRHMSAPESRWPPELWAECRCYAAPANASLEQWLEAAPDNFMTRELVGREALYGGAGSGFRRAALTPADLHLALQRLHYFAAVLLLEDAAGSMAQMAALFGWGDTDWEGARAGSRAGSRAEEELGPGQLARLRERNELDLQLYEYGARLHQQQVRELAARQAQAQAP